MVFLTEANKLDNIRLIPYDTNYDKRTNQMISKIKEIKVLKDIYDEDGHFLVSAVLFKVRFD